MESLSMQLQPFFQWLLRTTLQASLLICLILFFQIVLRSRLGARWHYCLWLLLLIRMAMPWAPQSQISIFNLIPQSITQQQTEYVRQEIVDDTVKTALISPSTTESKPASTTVVPQGSPKAITATPQIRKDANGRLKPVFSELTDILPLIWLAGALVLAVYVCVGNFHLWWLVTRERPLTDQKILDLLEDCKSQMGIRTILGVVITDKVKSPALFGFVRPRLLLPSGIIENLSLKELRHVFLHELAHLKRHDIYLGYLSSLLQVLHWFNPLIWLAFYRIRTDRELACDALVLSRTQNRQKKDYGRTIVSLLERFSRSQRLPAMAGILETKAQLKRRITMIARFKKNSYQWSPLAVILIIILACVSLPDARRTKASGISDAEPAPHISLRRVWSGPDVDAYGKVSSNGRYLSHTEWKNGDLAIRELATGKTQHLTETKKGGREKFFRFALNSVISPDGKLIAYSWTNQHGTYDLCVIGTDGSGDRTLYSSKDNELYPACWSSDGKRIAARKFTSKSGYMEIISVSVADGSVQVLKTSEKPFWPQFCYSSNDQFFIYDFPVEGNSENYDISLIFTDGRGEIPLINHPATDRLLGWVPNREDVLFLSNRASTYDIWAIKVVDNKPQGPPRPIVRDVGQISPQGFTQDGSFYFSRYTRRYTTYLVPFDRDTGEIKDELKSPLLGSNFDPEWSPDGRYIAYIEEQTEPEGPGHYHRPLHVRNVKTGEEQILASDFAVRAPRWSPDGSNILVTGKDRRRGDQLGYNGGIYKIDVQDGQVTELVQFPPVEVWSRDIWTRSVSEWASDGNMFFYTNRGRIIRRGLESGQEKQFYQNDNLERVLHLSPDGKRLLVSTRNRDEGTGSILVMPVSGGESTKLCKFQESQGGIQVPRSVNWTPDGNYILFAKSEEKGSTVWRISSKGGDPEVIWRSQDRVTDLSVHPYGEKIAVSTYLQEHSIWVMENFLPETPVAKPEPAVTLRRVEVRGRRGVVHSQPSFDGNYMSDRDRETGNLVVRDIATGKERMLTKTDPNWFAYESLISPENKRVAFLQFNPKKEDFDLQVIGFDGTDLRTLLGAEEIAGYFNLDAWSPDGRYIFGRLERKPMQLVRVSADDGSVQVIKTFDQNRASKVNVSPDGRSLAYDLAENKTSNPDIFVFDLKENRETPLVKHPANDKLLGWTPDGQHIFFTSDRNGTWDGWLLRVEDGKPRGLPEVIKAGMGDVSPIGFTRSGSFYYNFRHEAWNVYTAKLDLDTGKTLSAPSPVRHVGKDVRPDWSPDGQYLAYCSEPDRNKPQVVRIRTLATGQERQLKPELPYFDWLRWCPDNRHLLITNFNRGSPSVVYKLDVQTGEHTALVQSDEQRIRQAELSADGKTLAYRIRGLGNANRLIVRDMETGREKELLRSESMGAAALLFWALSPDGKHVAFSVREDGMNRAFVLKIISVASGEARTVVGDSAGELAWINDGRDLLFVKGFKELWRVSAEGEEPRKLWEWKQMLWSLRIHPDGQRIAFFSGGNMSEMWVMEDFLPTVVSQAK